MNRPSQRTSFPAMSTSVEIVGVGISEREIEAASIAGRELYDVWDRAFNRFRPDSELSRLNARTGQRVVVSEVFIDLLQSALGGAEATGHRFDPTILPALERAGYDRDIDAVRAVSQVPRRLGDRVDTADSTAVEVDRSTRSVYLPAGARLDVGGIAKGAFVERLAAEFEHWPGGCIDAGGDLHIWGEAPSGDHWVIGVEHPQDRSADALAAIVYAPSLGIATSGTNRRRWRTNGRDANHLIDPASGTSLAGPIRTATTFASSVTTAEIAAKAILVASARGERVERWGSDKAVLLTASDIGDPVVQLVSNPLEEEGHESPCAIVAIDSLFCPA